MNDFNTHSLRYEALDINLEKPVDITGYVEEGGSISYNSLNRIKATCTVPIIIAAHEKLNIDALRVYSAINNAEECLGTFFISMPDCEYEDEMQRIECIGYSTLIRISSNSPDVKYFIKKGTNAVAEVKRILTRLGYPFFIPDCNKTTSTNKEFDMGENYLNIINYLLDVVNYTSLHVDVYGNYISKPYVLPQDKESDCSYDEDDINNIVEPHQRHTINTFDIPNRFIRVCTSDPTLELSAVYTNTDGVTGSNSKWISADVKEVEDVSDYETLYALCKKAAAEAISIYEKVKISTALVMIPTYLAIVELKHYQAQGKYTCTSFDIALETGGSIELNLRKVVVV